MSEAARQQWLGEIQEVREGDTELFRGRLQQKMYSEYIVMWWLDDVDMSSM